MSDTPAQYHYETMKTQLKELRSSLLNNGDSEENGRIKAMVNTKLQEAEWALDHLYDKS